MLIGRARSAGMPEVGLLDRQRGGSRPREGRLQNADAIGPKRVARLMLIDRNRRLRHRWAAIAFAAWLCPIAITLGWQGIG